MKTTLVRRLCVALCVFLFSSVCGMAGESGSGSYTNRADRLEWFRDLGFGMFIHWSHDSQLGSVISHSMVAADEDYLKRFVEDLPKSFNPRRFNPEDWAALAKLAGMKYVVFTTKHHSGFCMFDTKTTDFGIMNTPFKRDITREVLDAFREQGISPGIYFSPDDFWWLYKNDVTIERRFTRVHPSTHPGLMALDLAQLRELYTGYGPIDTVFLDGPAERLRDLCWELQPNTVVTRGAIKTPEQNIPGFIMDEPWESCFTMGTQWQYKPTNEDYKSGWDVIAMLVETRAKGGNLLLNIGPKPDGELPIEQEERLREVALWMFVNSECIYTVRPWIVSNEGEYWFTKKKDENTVYVIVRFPPERRWQYGEWKDIVLQSVRATPQTQISVLGQNDKVIEYQDGVVPKTTWRQEPDGLHIRAMRAQRLYNDRKWPNPVVLKITHCEPGIGQPKVETTSVRWESGAAQLQGNVLDLAGATQVEAGFEHRDITGQDVNERTGQWRQAPLQQRASTGAFSGSVSGLRPGNTYEFRAVVKNPLQTAYGNEIQLEAR
jgi:alpha-L-fucosidase